jgi:DNA-binding SARP family transcriptional activator
MLRLFLFGALSVCADGSDAVNPARTHITGRPGSLLAFLALAPGRSFTRGELLATIWADHGEEVGIGAVNTLLWRLRKLVEKPPIAQTGLIACGRAGSIGLNPQAQITLDVNEFTGLVLPALAKPLERVGADEVDALRRAVNMYSADLLSDFRDEWILREREKHRRHYLNALGRLMQVSALGRDYASAIGYAQVILDRDALREDIHRELMRLFLHNGQRASALQQFERCRDVLKRELAIQPMPETLALYQSIADQAVGAVTRALGVSANGFSPGCGPTGPPAARELIESARQHLAQADAQLQLTLPHL